MRVASAILTSASKAARAADDNGNDEGGGGRFLNDAMMKLRWMLVITGHVSRGVFVGSILRRGASSA